VAVVNYECVVDYEGGVAQSCVSRYSFRCRFIQYILRNVLLLTDATGDLVSLVVLDICKVVGDIVEIAYLAYSLLALLALTVDRVNLESQIRPFLM